jgi:hypothetical protein
MPRTHRVDGNASELYANLEKVGFTVCRIQSSHERKGVPDAMVGRRWVNHLVEVKRLGRVLDPDQINFVACWKGCVHVGTNSVQLIDDLTECESRRLHDTPRMGTEAQGNRVV